jgi:esterase
MSRELLAHKIRGQGEIVILMHGLFGSSDNLGRIALALEEDFQVWQVDLRNHGQSFHSDTMSYPEMVEDLLLIMQVNKAEQVHLFGHSMGGKVAMQFALTYPEKVKSLIVADIAPVTYPPHHHAILKGLNRLDLSKVKNRTMADAALAEYIDVSSVRQFLLKSLDFTTKPAPRWKFNLTTINAHYQAILDACYSSRPYTGKTLFIAGGCSDYIKPEYKEATLKLFPETQLKIIPGASHWLHAEKPEIFIGLCQRFLKMAN